MSIKNNTTLLNSLLEQVNNLPDAVQAENLDAEIAAQNAIIAEQDAKIAELAEVLASKASGGNAEIETCTVIITGKIGDGDIIYQTYIDNKINIRINHSLTEQTLTDVICGSMIVIPVKTEEFAPLIKINGSNVSIDKSYYTHMVPALFNGGFIYCVFFVPATNGQTITIVCDNDD